MGFYFEKTRRAIAKLDNVPRPADWAYMSEGSRRLWELRNLPKAKQQQKQPQKEQPQPQLRRRPITCRGNILHFSNFSLAPHRCAVCGRGMVLKQSFSPICGTCRRLKRLYGLPSHLLPDPPRKGRWRIKRPSNT